MGSLIAACIGVILDRNPLFAPFFRFGAQSRAQTEFQWVRAHLTIRIGGSGVSGRPGG